MKRAEKEQAVTQLSEKLGRSGAVLLAEYRGLKVSQLTELRREIRKCEGDFRVVKNRLAKRALSQVGFEALQDFFKGPIGVAFVPQDAVSLAKILTKFAESYELFKLRAGLLGGKVLSPREIIGLSRLPSREELLAKLLGTLQAPAVNLVRVLQGVPQKLALVLRAIEKTKGGN